MHVHQQVDRRPLGHPHQVGVKREPGELGINRFQEREPVFKAAILCRWIAEAGVDRDP
jgi:hypothetical protein